MTERFSAHISHPGAHGQLDRQRERERKGKIGTEGLIHWLGWAVAWEKL